jgi:hypothetical protein
VDGKGENEYNIVKKKGRRKERSRKEMEKKIQLTSGHQEKEACNNKAKTKHRL